MQKLQDCCTHACKGRPVKERVASLREWVSGIGAIWFVYPSVPFLWTIAGNVWSRIVHATFSTWQVRILPYKTDWRIHFSSSFFLPNDDYLLTMLQDKFASLLPAFSWVIVTAKSQVTNDTIRKRVQAMVTLIINALPSHFLLLLAQGNRIHSTSCVSFSRLYLSTLKDTRFHEKWKCILHRYVHYSFLSSVWFSYHRQELGRFPNRKWRIYHHTSWVDFIEVR